ncbi:MAG TPA: sulfatase-like hydrolase/transferase [Chloroflexota bacterium]|nr:sulfatase-like hydrolase/transferase [Chloroflexota bacterium]
MSESPSPLNLLFITTDQQRWDSLPCYGLDFMRTPHLDRLAREGVVFERAYTPAPLCVPMRAALMSGQWPATLGVLDNSQWFPAGTGGVEGAGRDGVPVWPEAVTGAGYRTAGIGKMHFTPWDARLGFVERITAEDKRQYFWPDDYEKFLRANGIAKHHPTGLPGYFETLQASVFPHPRRFHVDAYVGDQAADWIARYGGAGQPPFAAWVSFPGPHDPYDPPQEMAAMYDEAPIPEPIPAPAGAGAARGQGGVRQSPLYQLDLSRATAEHYRRWRAHYYANISLIDEGIGKILGALEESGALERTLIVFTSDHGDALGDHGLAYKSAFYEPIARVPLLVRGPGVTPGGRCPALISTLDLVPLFYRTCGLEPPPVVQGIDPTPLLRDPFAPGRAFVFSELQGRTMVRDERFKYVHYRDRECELYDLQADPTEERNLAPDPAHTGELARLRGLLVEHALENSACRAVAAQREPAWHRNWAFRYDTPSAPAGRA